MKRLLCGFAACVFWSFVFVNALSAQVLITGENGGKGSPALMASRPVKVGGHTVTTAGRAPTKPKAQLSEVTLEDLMNIEVTSVSKKEQKLSKVAAAIFVITQEDIRRSAARSIPELLRMVPGVTVGQINSSTWAITARGFNGQFANKLLVLIDARTVYDPSNSGVYWDAQDTILEDIERIEVIRGPGATVWGTNAVNGVINIITKQAKDTQGGLLVGGGGSYEQGGSLRYGGKFGQRGHYRVFGKYLNRGSFDDFSDRDLGDDWHVKRSGFRTDWELSDRNSLTVQGDIYGGERGTPYGIGAALTPPFFTAPRTDNQKNSGGNLLARWSHTFRRGSEMRLQTYFDRISRVEPTDPELRSTFDVDFQHHVPLGSRHDVVWGFGYRYNADHMAGSFRVSFNPERFSSSVASGFIQDEINLVQNKVWLTAGTKIEHNVFSGVEVQPSVRLLWAPSNRHTLWGSYSNAIRIPARSFNHLRVNVAAFPGQGGVVSLISIFGNPQLDSEDLDAYEVGYRFQPQKRLSFDIAAFFNDYNHLRSAESGVPFFEASPPPPHLVIPQIFGSNLFGTTYGAEASVEWAATKFWKLHGGYAWFVPSMELEPASGDTSSIFEVEGGTPRNQFQVRSQFTLPHGLEFDTAVYRVGRLSAGGIPAYTRIDSRFAWRFAERMELSVAAQNLLDPRHPEFSALAQSYVSGQPKRSVYGSFTWRF